MQPLSSISRRDLLKAGGALVVSFAFDGVLPRQTAGQTSAAASDVGKPLDLSEVDSFLAIHADGSVTIYSGKVDVGTGLRIAVAQMAAEELGVSAERIRIIDGDTGLCPDQGGTGGSTGLTRGGMEIRQAAATARYALLDLGSVRLNRPAAELTIVDGEVRPLAGGAGVGIGALIGDRRLAVKVDPKSPVVAPGRYTVVGKPLPRPDVPDKCTGRHVYVHDFSLPGMLHARVVRPPTLGAKLVSVDERSVLGIPDVRVVRLDDFLALVAQDEWAAVKAASEIKATWSDWQGLPGNAGLERYLRDGAIDRDQTVVSKGDPTAAMSGAMKKLSASFFWPASSCSWSKNGQVPPLQYSAP